MTVHERAEKIINESGNTLHYRVVRALRNKGWVVEVSPYYQDGITEKTREVDIVAERKYPVHHIGKPIENLHVRLFIECKYLAKDVLFWFDAINQGRVTEAVTRDGHLGDPNAFSMTKKHHYFSAGRVAKLNSGGRNEEDYFYKALTQSLHAMVSPALRSQPLISAERMSAMISYPVIMVNDFNHLLGLWIESDEDEAREVKENFMWEVYYAAPDDAAARFAKPFYVDVVSLGRLDEFLEAIDSDMAAIRDYKSWR